MPREVASTEPVTTTMFSPLQLRPRSLLSTMSGGFARWMAAYVAPFGELVADHHTAVVVQSLEIDYTAPNLRFEEAAWLTAVTRMRTFDCAEWLHLTTDFRSGNRLVATGRLMIRVLALAGDASLAARPGALSAGLRRRFADDEVIPAEERRALAGSAPAMAGETLLPAQEWRTPLLRSHCEVADQWSFVEMVELATCARERLFTTGPASSAVVREALGSPFRNLRAVFRRPMFVFDECVITTAARPARDGAGVVFIHNAGPASSARAHLTVWETLYPGSREHQENSRFAAVGTDH